MLGIISAAIAPGVALLSYFYLRDKYEPEPISLVIRQFIFGIFLVFPVMALQHELLQLEGIPIWVHTYVITGLIEEFFKFFIIYITVFSHVEFDHPYDGVVYSVAVSLGFATLENFLYLVLNGVSLAFLRALLPVSGHALFGVLMGYYLGKSKFHQNPKYRRYYLLIALLLPVLLHGTFDFIILSSSSNWMLPIIPFMIALWWLGLHRVEQANQRQFLEPPIVKTNEFGSN
ncbi:glutamic-type intramembrane protease PrsW [Rubeoparvulum massiliense]|uniref:glutamic-type intramembrane protease PrsW n=1 Tax=Rubeoparvulum massiliense TaxID=1631346 RepID=UPI00065DC681|nr:glutamic-type intramembrane protease PrsW [Rubeoparvulum massiliense]